MARPGRRGEDDGPEVFVGKDVLELLGSSMYVNPLSVFREYIQNAADAVDEAVAAGVLPSIDDGLIEINLDHIDRRVVIRDNGRGLANRDFARRMLSFGASEKRGSDARGFRGVGRLAALGYVQQLVFRSRAAGDTKVAEAIWDGQVVKRMLASGDTDAGLRAIVRDAVTLNEREPGDEPAHFFEVELVRPRRIANDRLLNETEIGDFVSQVCPCPFSPEFPFREEVAVLLAPHGRAGKAYRIHINGAEDPVYRPYREGVEYSDARRAPLQRLKTFGIESPDGGPAAVGWLVHHDYQGAIPAGQGIRGLRARVGNIQVGHDRLFAEVFPEERFCSWTIGEVHVLDSRVVPNGRRDEFESGAHLDNIVAHLRPVGAQVARECRVSSRKRNRFKAFERAEDRACGKLDVLKQGAVSDRFAMAVRAEIGALLGEMGHAAGSDLFEEEERRDMRRRVAAVEEAVPAHAGKTEGGRRLEGVPAQKRAVYEEVFDLIYDCSASEAAAKSLVDRLLDRLGRP